MSELTPYRRSFSFTNFQQDTPDQPLPGLRVDVELDNIAAVTRTIVSLIEGLFGIELDIDAIVAVANEITKVVFVADNMDDIRDANEYGPDISRAVDLFLGAADTDPTTGHGGDPLTLGAVYYNTVYGETRIWTGTVWIPMSSLELGGVIKGSITAEEGQTDFVIGDYLALSVARNGLVLTPDEDVLFSAPNITVPDAQEGDEIVYFGILRGAAQKLRHFASRGEAQAASIGSEISNISYTQDGRTYHFVYDASGTALTTAGTRKWSPDKGHPFYVQHWGVETTAAPADATTDYTDAVQRAVDWTRGQLLFDGFVKITDQITVPKGCVLHAPNGRNTGGLYVDGDFTLSQRSATGAAGVWNVGNPTISAITVGGQALIGRHQVIFDNTSDFTVYDPDGVSIGTGTTGTAFSVTDVLGFTITAGSTPAEIGDKFDIKVRGGVILAPDTEGWEIGDFCISFYQPADAATRADLIKYPPAIQFDPLARRPKTGSLRIEGAWDGINADGNQGGAWFGKLEIGAFHDGLVLDGALDFVHLEGFHAWAFGATSADLLALRQDGNVNGLILRQCHGLRPGPIECWQAHVRVNDETMGALGNPTRPGTSFIPHVFNGLTLDGGYASLFWENGWGLISDFTGHASVKVSGGSLTVNGGTLTGATTDAIEVTGGRLYWQGGKLDRWALARAVSVSGTGFLQMHGTGIQGRAGTRTDYLIRKLGASATVDIQDINVVGFNAGYSLIQIENDNAGDIVDISNLRYYYFTFPNGASLGKYRMASPVGSDNYLRFSTVAQFKSYVASRSFTLGTIAWVGDFGYHMDGTTNAVPGLDGWAIIGDVTPQHFGARADGATDDTDAIDAWWDYVVSTAPGHSANVPNAGQVNGRIPAGKYASASGLVLTCDKSFVNISGEGTVSEFENIDFVFRGAKSCVLEDFILTGDTETGLTLELDDDGNYTRQNTFARLLIRDKTEAGIILDGCSWNVFEDVECNRNKNNVQVLSSNGDNFTNCHFVFSNQHNVAMYSGGEVKLTACTVMAGGQHAHLGSWANLYVYGSAASNVVENYFVNSTFTQCQWGNRVYPIATIENNGSGKIRVTTVDPHELVVGVDQMRLLNVGVYNGGGDETAVLAVISPTVVDLDRDYISDVTGGTISMRGWDVLIDTESTLTQLNDLFFTNCNINYLKINSGYNLNFNGCRLKQQVWLGDSPGVNRLFIERNGRGRQASTFLDIPIGGPGSAKGWAEILYSATSSSTSANDKVVMRMPNLTLGVGADNRPVGFNAVSIDRNSADLIAGAYSMQFREDGKLILPIGADLSVTEAGQALIKGNHGLGVAQFGASPFIANIDTPGAAGIGYTTGSSSGTFPASLNAGTVFTGYGQAGRAFQMFFSSASPRMFIRVANSSTWGAWAEVVTSASTRDNISSAPLFPGQQAVVSGVGYMATGTSSAADWKQITNI